MVRFFTLALFFSLGAAVALQAQHGAPPRPDARLYAVFDSAYIAAVQRDFPTQLARWNYYLDHAFIITDYPAEKGSVAALPVVQLADADAPVNILLLEKEQRLARDWQKPTAYRINDSNRVLLYYAGRDFNLKFRQWLSRQ